MSHRLRTGSIPAAVRTVEGAMLLEMNVTLGRGRFGLSMQLSASATCVGLFGKSGAGKSAVFDLISGALQPQSGRIVLNGKILSDSTRGIVMPRELRPVGAAAQIDGAGYDSSGDGFSPPG
ncbi:MULTISPECIES: ATP-binding cassette domain-containing protein [Methylomicrobium]|uniref:ABC transporter domain-containing protein n=1 Tax=Methylomicrobium album BG8 TaxID=686340 RepID=H8GIJ4_METAL|nr:MULTISPECIES: ATP-binding cassette domain-containing protein [Methylomicrobium]EIC29021.1 hypothetical protein Metal_1212 [Methylomicrobium album BG8]